MGSTRETTTPCIPSGSLNRAAKSRSRSRTDKPSAGPRWLDGLRRLFLVAGGALLFARRTLG